MWDRRIGEVVVCVKAAKAQILATVWVLDWSTSVQSVLSTSALSHLKEKQRVSGPGWKGDNDITASTVVGASQMK